jgi:hypothetical protein
MPFATEDRRPGNGDRKDHRAEPPPGASFEDRVEFSIVQIQVSMHDLAVEQERSRKVQEKHAGSIDMLVGHLRARGLSDSMPPPLPPMRRKLESLSTLDEEITSGGTHVYRGNKDQMDAIIDARSATIAEAKYAQLKEADRIASAAAPVLFFRGAMPGAVKATIPLVLVAAGAAVMRLAEELWSQLFH